MGCSKLGGGRGPTFPKREVAEGVFLGSASFTSRPGGSRGDELANTQRMSICHLHVLGFAWHLACSCCSANIWDELFNFIVFAHSIIQRVCMCVWGWWWWWCISFLWLLQQITASVLVANNQSLFSHSSGRLQVRKPPGPHSVWGLSGWIRSLSLAAFGGSRHSLARDDTTTISALLFTWLPLLSVSSACLFQGHLSLDLRTPGQSRMISLSQFLTQLHLQRLFFLNIR